MRRFDPPFCGKIVTVTDDTGIGYGDPADPPTDARYPVTPVPAGRWRRLLAAIIDGLIVGPVTIAVHLALFGKVGVSVGANLASALPAYAYYLLIGLRPGNARGQSLGKQLIGLRVVSIDGDWVASREWVTRETVTIVLGVIGSATFAFSWLSLVDLLPILARPDRRAVHDLIAGTIVVDATTATADRF